MMKTYGIQECVSLFQLFNVSLDIDVINCVGIELMSYHECLLKGQEQAVQQF